MLASSRRGLDAPPRPDGYVAFAGKAAHAPKLHEYLDTWHLTSA